MLDRYGYAKARRIGVVAMIGGKDKTRIRNATPIDFETKPIKPMPDYPPEPVGVSIRWPADHASKYYAFGHPDENNCTRDDARRALEAAWQSGLPLLFHHAKFDLAVATEWFKLPMPHGTACMTACSWPISMTPTAGPLG
jgi:hypothetical protein